MTNDRALREQLTNLLVAPQAHLAFEDAVANFPETYINAYPPSFGYTFWHLLEHLRFAQYDILDYIRNPAYQPAKFPDDYWPVHDAKTDVTGWRKTIQQFLTDRRTLVDLVQDEGTDLYVPIPHGQAGHTILREIFIVADHNAYHIGELGALRQIMQLW